MWLPFPNKNNHRQNLDHIPLHLYEANSGKEKIVLPFKLFSNFEQSEAPIQYLILLTFQQISAYV